MNIDAAFVYFWWWRTIFLALAFTLPVFEIHLRGLRYEMKKMNGKEVPANEEKDLFHSLAVSLAQVRPETFFDYLLVISTFAAGLSWLAAIGLVIPRIILAIFY